MKEARLQKQLQSQLNTLLADAEALKTQIAGIQKEYTAKNEAIKALRIEINKLNNAETPKVSEHAIVRYFERVKGYNIEAIEQEILSEKVIAFIKAFGGNGKFPNGDFAVILKNNTVTTVVTD